MEREPDDVRLRRRRAALEARARILSAVRGWFERQGFLEVETPARVRAPGQEVHLDAISTGAASRRERDARWLVTSPEYAMKRMCGAGFEKIVSVGKCWRAEEAGPHHQSEFTMIEWYRAHAPLTRIADDCEELARIARDAVVATWKGGAPSVEGGGPRVGFVRTTVRELFRQHAGTALAGDESPEDLRRIARACDVNTGNAEAWDDIFFQIWLDRIEPVLATAANPTFVFDWPTPLAALARRHSADPRIAERFELYAGGLELVNAFGELIDSSEQRARFMSESVARGAAGKVTYPIDEALLAALDRMPPTSGSAMGFDRFAMWILGLPEIRDVMAFADDEV